MSFEVPFKDEAKLPLSAGACNEDPALFQQLLEWGGFCCRFQREKFQLPEGFRHVVNPPEPPAVHGANVTVQQLSSPRQSWFKHSFFGQGLGMS